MGITTMPASVQIFYPLEYGLQSYKPQYKSPEHPLLIKELFGLPINIVIGESNQSLFEYSLAYSFSQLAKEAIDLSGIPKEPMLGIIKSGDRSEDDETVQFKESTWSFGSVHRNPLTRLLATNQRDGNIAGLDAGLRPDLPSYFDILDGTVDNMGYYAYARDERDLLKGLDMMGAEIDQTPELGKYLSLEIELGSEPIVQIKSSNRTYMPEYDTTHKRFTKDYFMITQMYSLNPQAQAFGQKNVVVAGCHDLGTLTAMSLLLSGTNELKDISEKVDGGLPFQVIGSVDIHGRSQILDIVKF